jgi:hypothetical protein
MAFRGRVANCEAAAERPEPPGGPARHAILIGFPPAAMQRARRQFPVAGDDFRQHGYDPPRHSLAVFRATR